MKRGLRLLCALLAALFVCPQPVLAAEAPQQHIYAVSVNGAAVSQGAIILEQADGSLLVAEDDLRTWGFKLEGHTPVLSFEKQAYFALRDFPGVKTTLDAATQTLAIQAPPDLFRSTAIAIDQFKSGPPVFDGTKGAYLNYDLAGEDIAGRASASGIFQFAYTGLPGGATISNTMTAFSGTGSTASISRFATTYRRDNIPALATLRIGDATSSSGTIGGSVPFFGIQRQTDFAENPNFISIPTFGVNGVSLSQSTVDVFINGVQAAHQSVNAGPFTISNLPTIDGQGNVTVVVRDILGRDHVIVTPFYYTRGLLKPGLNQSSFEGGIERRDFGPGLGSYRGAVGSATLRRGITNSFTAEAHVEGDSSAGLFELGGDLGVPRVGAFHGAAAMSTAGGRSGARGTLAYDYSNVAGKFSTFATVDAQTAAFETVGRPALGEEVTLSGGVRLRVGKVGSFSTAFINRKDALQPAVTVLSGGYSRPLAGGFFNASITRDMRNGAMGATFYFTGLLTGRRGVDVQGSAGTAGRVQRAVLHQSVPDDGYGPGFDIGYGRSPNAEVDATLFERTRFGDGLFGLGRSSGNQGVTSSQFLWHGALALLGGRLLPTREIGGSYGLIRIPGFPNVRVYLDAGLIGTTDAHGDLFVENFSPYINNYITVDARDVPLNITVDSLTAKVVPFARNAAIVRFKFRRDGGVLMKAVDSKGVPLPFGTVLTSASGESWSVAQDGAAYLNGVPSGPLLLVAKSLLGSCNLLVTVPADTSEIPNIGQHACDSSNETARIAGARRDPDTSPIASPVDVMKAPNAGIGGPSGEADCSTTPVCRKDAVIDVIDQKWKAARPAIAPMRVIGRVHAKTRHRRTYPQRLAKATRVWLGPSPWLRKVARVPGSLAR